MNEIFVATSPSLIVPTPRIGPITTRIATMDDLPFLDRLQKQYHRQLGFFPRKQMEGYVEGGWVLIAEDAATGAPIGYCISRDRYLKRDELGVIYQLCVAPDHQRGLIGAALIKAVFERAAYGCRLFCCWCAQDLAANYFWESLGFVPIAFRAGSTGKRRVHIFWQRRIDADQSQMEDHRDAVGQRKSAIPYWYPFQTNGGAIRADRIVFPIPPGVRWQDVEAVALPSDSGLGILPEPARVAPRKRSGETPKPRKAAAAINSLAGKVGILVGGRIKYVDRPGYVAPKPEKPARRPKAEKGPAPKIDPKYLAAARELRDRYLEQVNGEQVNEGRFLPAAAGKYDVTRTPGTPEGRRQLGRRSAGPKPMALPDAA